MVICGWTNLRMQPNTTSGWSDICHWHIEAQLPSAPKEFRHWLRVFLRETDLPRAFLKMMTSCPNCRRIENLPGDRNSSTPKKNLGFSQWFGSWLNHTCDLRFGACTQHPIAVWSCPFGSNLHLRLGKSVKLIWQILKLEAQLRDGCLFHQKRIISLFGAFGMSEFGGNPISLSLS